MAKVYFYCQSCGHETPKWLGKCPSCNQWNTIVEELTDVKSKKNLLHSSLISSKPTLVSDIKQHSGTHFSTLDSELDTVLGGGLVEGAVILLAGEPGIGKSTLLLQVALSGDRNVLYVSGEEAPTQIKIRADRIGITNKRCHIYSETSTQKIIYQCAKMDEENQSYKLVIIDSIQTLYSDLIQSPIGSISQIKQCCAELLNYAKNTSTPIILIGHITKEGQIAGPKVLEHMVDVVLHFEGQKTHLYRLLRGKKNRFGSTAKVGVYEMLETGLKAVLNPSTILINKRDKRLSGTAISSTFEGQKTFLVEVQSLVTPAVYGTPQRTATGFNVKRLHMLLAVLEKKCAFKLGSQDVFLNIAGGISVSDPSLDLGVIAALLSSKEDILIPSKMCFSGEVGLNGEIRPIPRIQMHIEEAERIGFETIIISKDNQDIDKNKSIEIIKCSRVMDVYLFLSNLSNKEINT